MKEEIILSYRALRETLEKEEENLVKNFELDLEMERLKLLEKFQNQGFLVEEVKRIINVLLEKWNRYLRSEGLKINSSLQIEIRGEFRDEFRKIEFSLDQCPGNAIKTKIVWKIQNIDENLIGKMYERKACIGRGRQALVWRVEHKERKKIYVLKEYERKEWEFGKNEAEILRKLSHPGIPKLYDVLEEGESLYLIIDYIDGEDFFTYNKSQKMQKKEVEDFAYNLADILQYLHSLENPIVHGDIKPENILVSKSGKIYLIDFGAASVMGEKRNTILGTRKYAPREQRGNIDGSRPYWDVYAWAKILEEIKGQSPIYLKRFRMSILKEYRNGRIINGKVLLDKLSEYYKKQKQLKEIRK